ncbi:MAG TPA: hypothetical protein VGO23_07965 [Pseudonocardia sp.]|jgi:hypothetical protein|nr:hypothetical protein [Pseudonocardia sp.]
MTRLDFGLPDGTTRSVAVPRLLDAGYAGRAQEARGPGHRRHAGLGYVVDRMPDPIG